MKLLLVEVTEWIKYQSTKYFETERERKSLNNAFCRLVVVVVKDEISQQTRNTNFFNVSPITFQLDGNFSLEIVYGLAVVWDLKSNVSFYDNHKYFKWIIAPFYNVNYCSFRHAEACICSIKSYPSDLKMKFQYVCIHKSIIFFNRCL